MHAFRAQTLGEQNALVARERLLFAAGDAVLVGAGHVVHGPLPFGDALLGQVGPDEPNRRRRKLLAGRLVHELDVGRRTILGAGDARDADDGTENKNGKDTGAHWNSPLKARTIPILYLT